MTRVIALCGLLTCLFAFGGCTVESERKTPLPWLMVKVTKSSFGGFGGHTQVSYFAKYYGFWRGLDTWQATVLDPTSVLVRNDKGYGILHQGSLKPVSICTKTSSITVSPGSATLDCVDGAEQTGGHLTTLTWQRLAFSGKVLEERTLSVVGPQRIFPQILVYDDEGIPYFLAENREAAGDYREQPRGCALLSGRRNDSTPVPGPPLMSWQQCFERAQWEKLVGRRLHQPKFP